MFKIILYTSSKKKDIKDVLFSIDKNHYIYHMFFKKSMVNIEGKLLKNLRIAETDITKVLALDVSAENFIHKENCILVSPYAQHNKKDTELKELITFLKERVNLEDETLDFRKITKEYKNAPDKAE